MRLSFFPLPADESTMPGLDASVKKNSAFTKKLKEITDKQRDPLVKELKGLKLSKYIAEGSDFSLWIHSSISLFGVPCLLLLLGRI